MKHLTFDEITAKVRELTRAGKAVRKVHDQERAEYNAYFADCPHPMSPVGTVPGKGFFEMKQRLDDELAKREGSLSRPFPISLQGTWDVLTSNSEGYRKKVILDRGANP